MCIHLCRHISYVAVESYVVLSNTSIVLRYTGDEVVGGVTSETDLVLSEGYDSLLEQSRRLKRDVECLREFVSEQLAIQVSTACHIQ